jgi:Flp pilus assembly protein TadG
LSEKGLDSEAPDMLTRFASDRRGAVAIFFAFALVPLLAVAGITMEYSRSTRALADLQSAVDGAALAAGKGVLDLNQRDVTQVARAAFDTAFRPESGVSVTRFKATQKAERLTVEAEANVPSIFSGVIGRKGMRSRRAPRSRSGSWRSRSRSSSTTPAR